MCRGPNEIATSQRTGCDVRRPPASTTAAASQLSSFALTHRQSDPTRTTSSRVHTDRHHASATINVSSSRSPPRHLLPSLPLPYAASLSSWASWIPAYAGDLLLLSLRESFSIRSKDFFFRGSIDHDDDWIGQNSEFIWEFLCVWKCISQFCSKKNLKLGILDFGFEFEGILVSCRIFFFFFLCEIENWLKVNETRRNPSTLIFCRK